MFDILASVFLVELEVAFAFGFGVIGWIIIKLIKDL